LSDKITFSFGENWKRFVELHLDPERVRIATASVSKFLERSDLRGMTFLDVGCGSGLFSLAAHHLGADKITSVDIDPFSIESTTRLREAAGNPDHWTVLHGSILDPAFTARIPPADIVYAWGSLHHTGGMWQAIRNSANLVAPGGLLFLAIYNKVEGNGSSEYWLKMKKLYNRQGIPVKRLMEVAYVFRHHVVPDLIRFRNPLAFNRNYKDRRGMNFWTDVRDWLGGYPYEFAGADEIFRFCTRELGLALVNLHTVTGLGLNEFLFRAPQSHSATP
jgi:2-polyprenyl-3-methyl-5-hydroxy-6-metoxy-1,4-benzoquinol methylase